MVVAGQEYLVHHGAAGHLGRFRAAAGAELPRGAKVVVQGRRGLELGDVLRPAVDRGLFPDEFVGELLRSATEDDLAAEAQNRALGQRLFESAALQAEALGAPVSVVDVEVALDGQSALLHGLRLGPGDCNQLLSDLGDKHGMIVRIFELNQPVVEDEHGCGSCGSGGCGSCGAGGCSSCSSGAGKELAEYFAELRAQMEQKNRVALL